MKRERDDMMLRARAYSDYARRTGRSAKVQAQLEMAGFLALFHPEIPDEERARMAREASESET